MNNDLNFIIESKVHFEGTMKNEQDNTSLHRRG